ncbi:ATP-grasp domain-containing protein [Tenacibaculum sp. ZS6-P6]|uniref:ATP-grasp domain-containing protein n=1 Tax=Tenacibaculum sp. ZS6-P6 TaxID=3447503 RepID=UPI003F9BA31B
MRIIFCDAVFDSKTIEPDYEEEKNIAVDLGFNFSLISYEALVENELNTALKFVPNQEKIETAFYRGWMITPQQYENLYEGLLKKNIKLINDPESYKHCHYLPNSYDIIKTKTPKSNWTTDLTDVSILKLAQDFDKSPIIVKDYVKSEKHHWEDACFIPNASDSNNVKTIVHNFIKLRGNTLNEGIVFRAFKELEFLTEHSKSGMPLTKEFRIFFGNKKMIQVFNYWDEGDYGTSEIDFNEFKKLALKIKSNFFTMDIAQKKTGEWIIMELGDGQVAGLPENANKKEFYSALKMNFKT